MRAMCGVQLKDSERAKDFMLILGLGAAVDKWAVVSSMHGYGQVWWSEDGHILRGALIFKVEGQRVNGRLKKRWMVQVGEESRKVGLSKEDVLHPH